MGLVDKVKEVASGVKLTADSAYSMSKYGEVVNDNDLLRRFYSRVDDYIRIKSDSSKYGVSLYGIVYDIDEDISPYINDVVKHYEELGFMTKIIDNKVFDNLNGVYLFISWKKR